MNAASHFFRVTEAIAPVILDAALKSILILAVAALSCRVARGASAAFRHRIWLAAMVALLSLPVLSATLPKWQVLPAWASLPNLTPLPQQVSTPPAESAFPQLSTTSISTALAGSSSRSPGLMQFISSIWAAGFLIVVARLCGGWVLLRLSVRKAERTSDTYLLNEFNEACSDLSIAGIDLRTDPQRVVPFVFGMVQRHLVLPHHANRWPKAQLQAVLRHELAHLKRGDPQTLLLGAFCCALYWINPVVWIAARELNIESEVASDNQVLNLRPEPEEYAQHLIAMTWFAHESDRCSPAIMRRSQLERRVVAAIHHGTNRGNLSYASQVAIFLVSAVVVWPLSSLSSRPGDPPLHGRSLATIEPQQTIPATERESASHVAVEIQSRERSSLILDQFNLADIAGTLQRIAQREPNALVFIRDTSGTNHVEVVKLARFCRNAGLRCTFVSNFSTNTAPLLPSGLERLPSRSRLVAVNVDANRRLVFRAEGFKRTELLAALGDLRTVPASVLVRFKNNFYEYPDARVALGAMGGRFQ